MSAIESLMALPEAAWFAVLASCAAMLTYYVEKL